jgi:hypothetical protein
MGERVPRQKTVISDQELTQAMVAAWKNQLKTVPTGQQIALLKAQVSLETGHGKACWNYNVGNITTSGKGNYDYFDTSQTNEQVSPGSWKKMNLKYRAYPSLQAGVEDYLAYLQRKQPSAFEHILHPDPVQFSKALKKGGYYTADEDKYTASLNKIFQQQQENTTIPQEATQAPEQGLYSFLDNILRMISASKKEWKKLPKQKVLLRIASDNPLHSTEFARVLSLALDEELQAKSSIHAEGNAVEISCSLPGMEKEVLAAVKGVSSAIAEAFCCATSRLGGIKVSSDILPGRSSVLATVDPEQAEKMYHRFLLKMI